MAPPTTKPRARRLPQDGGARCEEEVRDLRQENVILRKEKLALARQMEQARAQLARRLRELQAGVQARVRNGESKSSIMEYVKAGFGGMLGALGALLVVDVVSDALAGVGQADVGDENGDGDAEVGNAFEADTFELFGGRQQRAQRGAQEQRSFPRKKTNPRGRTSRKTN